MSGWTAGTTVKIAILGEQNMVKMKMENNKTKPDTMA